MLTNNDSKLIHSLVKKKFRQKYNKFVVEGVKNIKEVINSSIQIDTIYTTEEIFAPKNFQCKTIHAKDLKKISQLVSPNVALAVCEIPAPQPIQKEGFILALDDVRDPGNLGTILRMADWFGIDQIICSEQTVDLYNPKVIQASMSSFLRVQVNYVDLGSFFSSYEHPILGTFMEGENVYQTQFPTQGVLLMGNEANGISENLCQMVTQKITIPRLGNLQATESLNVAMATSMILGERASALFKS